MRATSCARRLRRCLGFVETLQGPAKDDPAARDKFLADHARPGDPHGAADRRSAVAVAHRTQRASATDTPLDLAPIVRQVVDGLLTLARDRGVEINVALPHETSIVLGDRDELIRALENLVENALKYGAAGKRVDVTLTRDKPALAAGSARRGTRLRTWHRSGAPAAPDRTLLPRGCHRQPCARRNRVGSCAGQACAQPARRASDDREHAGGRGDVHDACSPARR